MVNAAPAPDLAGIDAYCYPEIFYRQALGIEATANPAELRSLHAHGVRRIVTCGVSPEALSRALFIARANHRPKNSGVIVGHPDSIVGLRA